MPHKWSWLILKYKLWNFLEAVVKVVPPAVSMRVSVDEPAAVDESCSFNVIVQGFHLETLLFCFAFPDFHGNKDCAQSADLNWGQLGESMHAEDHIHGILCVCKAFPPPHEVKVTRTPHSHKTVFLEIVDSFLDESQQYKNYCFITELIVIANNFYLCNIFSKVCLLSQLPEVLLVSHLIAAQLSCFHPRIWTPLIIAKGKEQNATSHYWDRYKTNSKVPVNSWVECLKVQLCPKNVFTTYRFESIKGWSETVGNSDRKSSVRPKVTREPEDGFLRVNSCRIDGSQDNSFVVDVVRLSEFEMGRGGAAGWLDHPSQEAKTC